MNVDLNWALRIATGYEIKSDITYLRFEGVELKLDVYQPAGDRAPKPTLMFFHAGGWADDATKETWSLWFLPFLQLGWVVVNVDYRPATVSPAPAAVEDCRNALLWVGANATQYDIDIQHLVLAGLSAGGHLALITGMLPGNEIIHPIAIVSWCGITDVIELIEGPHVQSFALAWIGDRPNRRERAEAISPIRHVRAGLPPIITIHGDLDRDVPYSQAVRFHQLLSAAGIRNELITAHGVGHSLDVQALAESYPRVFEFLRMSGVPA